MGECKDCGTVDCIRIKDIPLPGGRTGHIRLAEWTYYCKRCVKKKGELLAEQIDELYRRRQEGDTHEPN